MTELWDQSLIVLQMVVAPALGASLAVMLLVRLVGGERGAPLAAALAVAAGIIAGNHFRNLMTDIANQQHPTLQEVQFALSQAVEPMAPSRGVEQPPNAGEEQPPAPPRVLQRHYWLPWLAGLAMVLELLVRLPNVPLALAWVARAAFACFAARMLAPLSYRSETPDAPWLLGASMLLEWAILIGVSQLWKDALPGAVLALCLVAATLLVSQQAAGPSLSEMLALGLAALLGPTLVALLLPSDTGPALAAGAVILPAMLLIGHEATDPPRGLLNFLLIGLAPLALAPLLLPFAEKLPGWKRWGLALVLPLIPLALAVFWTLQETPLPDFGT